MNSSSQPPYDSWEEILRKNLREHPWDFQEQDWYKLEKKMKEAQKNRSLDWFTQQALYFFNVFRFLISLLSIPVTSLV